MSTEVVPGYAPAESSGITMRSKALEGVPSSSNYNAQADLDSSVISEINLEQYLLGGMHSDKAHLDTLTKTITR